jgi:U3 small nucleolar RNA-associated protein 14
MSSDDEEISEGEAFNAEDERRYGNLVPLKSGGGSGSDGAYDDEDDDGGEADEGEEGAITFGPGMLAGSDDDGGGGGGGGGGEGGGEGHGKLLSMLANMDEGDGGRARRSRRRPEQVEDAEESEFGGRGGGGGGARGGVGGGVTLDALVAPLRNSTGYGALKKQLSSLEKSGAPVKPREAPVVEARAERKLLYTGKSADMAKWQPMVKRNREAETLSFNKDAPRENLSHAALVSKFKPSTELEQGMDALLAAGGMGGTKGQSGGKQGASSGLWGGGGDGDVEGLSEVDSDEDRGPNGRPGTSELAMLRSRMSYEAAAAKRVKKIKSKAYHKVRNRQDKQRLERLEEQMLTDNPEMAAELEAQRAEKRVEERMTLRHKNTSSWVKHALKAHGDVNQRKAGQQAVSEQLRIAAQLRKKATAADEEDSDSDEEGGGVSGGLQRARGDALELMERIENDEANADGAKAKGVFGLKFMQRALSKQREAAQSKVQDLLGELKDAAVEHGSRGGGAGSDSSDGGNVSEGWDEGSDGDGAPTVAESAQDRLQAEQRARGTKKAVDKVLRVGALQVEQGPSSARVSGNITVPGVPESAAADDDDASESESESEGERRATRVGSKKRKAAPSQTSEAAAAATAAAAYGAGTGSNPWMKVDGEEGQARGGKKKHKKAAGKAAAAARADALSEEVLPEATMLTVGETSAAHLSSSESQQELMRRAFAADNTAEEEFAREKAEQVERETGEKVPKVAPEQPGWGSWTGEGAPEPKKRKPKRAVLKQAAAFDKATKARADHGIAKVIIGERRNKKASKYKVEQVPYPFTSREQYERSLRHPLGREWNTAATTGKLTAPDVVVNGSIIAPAKLSKSDKARKTNKRKGKF